MKGLLHRLLESMNLSGRDWAVLLLSLLLAFSMWLIHNLSLKYNSYLSVNVVAHCNVNGHSDVSAGKSEITARCRAKGYTILSSSLFGGRTADVTFSPSVMKHYDGDVYCVTSDDLNEYAHLLYGDGVTVEYFLSDTVFFRFPEVEHKRVPVMPVYSVHYSSQYMSSGSFDVTPDSVTVYGEPFQLENVTCVYTEPVKHSDVSEDVHGVVRLKKIKGIRLSADDVHYSMDVTRYVEIRQTVPVETVNVPSGKEMLVFPSSVEVTLRCVFPLMDDPYENVRFQADYSEFASSLSGKCAVRALQLPKGVISSNVEPAAVGCVIEDM
ncbi:MAG: hypothetical protein K1V99_12170 [Bacteroidales bacterium]|nr:hypothetical protein [Bacteroidales bacterium]